MNLESILDINYWKVATLGLIALIGYYLKNPEKFEKLVSLILKFLNYLSERFDKSYIKYDLQGKINDYLKTVSKKVKHIDIEKINVEWIDVSTQTTENYIQNGKLIIRLHKSENQIPRSFWGENVSIVSLTLSQD